MLKEITIKDWAVIDNLSIELSGGLNVLTGETGAGKSVLIDALDIALGGRVQSGFARPGKENAVITAVFETGIELPILDDLGLDYRDGIIVRRVLSVTGKNKAFINDIPVGVQTLQRLGDALVDIHSQNEHQSLLSREVQTALLDAYGSAGDILTEYRRLYREYNSLNSEIEALKEGISDRARRVDILRFQIDEIERAALKGDELVTLVAEEKILSNLTTITGLCEGAYAQLYEDNGSVTGRMRDITSRLQKLNAIDEKTGELAVLSEQIETLVKELQFGLRGYKDGIEHSPQRLSEVIERIETIKRLQKKYGEDIEGYGLRAKEELYTLENSDERLDGLLEKKASVYSVLSATAEGLSGCRTKTAVILSAGIVGNLEELSFQRASFEISVVRNIDDEGGYRFSPSGVDTVEFLFSANPGIGCKPIGKVASGGELSRVMLALKTIFAECDRIPVLIFDEIDAGIGGKTAEAVAEKLKGIASSHQVLCITHLPQVAAAADYHLNVTKEIVNDAVNIEVRPLEQAEREIEIARMLSGTVSDISIKHAQELLSGRLDDKSSKSFANNPDC